MILAVYGISVSIEFTIQKQILVNTHIHTTDIAFVIKRIFIETIRNQNLTADIAIVIKNFIDALAYNDGANVAVMIIIIVEALA
jgi:hypothetical protein